MFLTSLTSSAPPFAPPRAAYVSKIYNRGTPSERRKRLRNDDDQRRSSSNSKEEAFQNARISVEQWILGLGNCARGPPETMLRFMWDLCYYENEDQVPSHRPNFDPDGICSYFFR